MIYLIPIFWLNGTENIETSSRQKINWANSIKPKDILSLFFNLTVWIHKGIGICSRTKRSTFSDKGYGFPNDASVRERHPYFKFHIVSPDKKNKTQKLIKSRASSLSEQLIDVKKHIFSSFTIQIVF